MENKLSKSQFLSVAIMLFGMFFGAGNLIFPPLLANQAGKNTYIALFAFCISAVVFPVLGVVVVAKTHGLSNLAKRVDGRFAIVFTTLIYLSIGPGLGIPRAGSVPFEMAVQPYLGQGANVSLARFLFTAVFFTLAYLVCTDKAKIVERTGKFLTPALLLLIAVMFFGVLFNKTMDVREPIGMYKTNPLTKGFVEGYNTMDTVAALNFGLVISLTIRQFKVGDSKKVISYTVKAGIFAGLLLSLVYFALSFIGMSTSNIFSDAPNGALILTKSSKLVYGDFAAILLALIFTLACLTTCIGLISSGSEYFTNLFNKKLSYKAWVRLWTFFSFLMANFGLNTLLKFSLPLLTTIYPVSLVLIVMALSEKHFKYSKQAYIITTYVTVFLSIVFALKSVGVSIYLVTDLAEKLPFAEYQLGWLVPSFISLILSSVFTMKEKSAKEIVEFQGQKA